MYYVAKKYPSLCFSIMVYIKSYNYILLKNVSMLMLCNSMMRIVMSLHFLQRSMTFYPEKTFSKRRQNVTLCTLGLSSRSLIKLYPYCSLHKKVIFFSFLKKYYYLIQNEELLHFFSCHHKPHLLLYLRH